MTALRNTAPNWIDRTETTDWASRVADAVLLLADAVKAGFEAEHEYHKLTRKGVKPQDASAAVLKRLSR